jgi:hypothetical protein
MRLELAKTCGSIAVVAAFVCGLWPATAQAIVCENEKGRCEVTVDGTTEEGSCLCADCSGGEQGWGGGGGDEPLPEPTEEYCLEMLEMTCMEEPITDAADECTPEALDACHAGLIEFFMTCGGAWGHDEELCATVGCCEMAEEMGIAVLAELWDCVKQYTSCEQAMEACFGGDGDDAGGGMGDGDDGDDGGDDGGGDATGNWGDYDEEGGSDDTKGCACHLAGAAPWAAPLLLVPLWGLLRRRR